MHRFLPFIKTVAFIMLCLWLPGCATSPPTKFYLLSPMMSAPDTETGHAQDQHPKTVRVDGVVVPGYLDRDEIVTRVGEHQIHLADLDRWGEPLRNSLTSILALNLSRQLPAKDFVVFPFKCPSPVDYQIIVEIIRMDGSFDGDVHLSAQWSILVGKDSDVLISRESNFKESRVPTDYNELVAAQSRLVEALSREIAKSLQADL